MFEKDVLFFIGTIPVDDVMKGHITEVTDAPLARRLNRHSSGCMELLFPAKGRI
ncbi:hypothetical protein ACQKFE_18240 [Stutzerimonas stutzeri]|jgi:hypothetical protein|uniref:hypothetical protein n=1 Tax=Pseudomonadaceae TaxID=135621 RepID=UPI00289FA1D1|nr:hypothetical protein [Pseudomonas aeruginosa]